MKCQLCQIDFKTKARLDTHLLRKTACISAENILQQMELKNSELNYTKNKMKTSEDHADMFRKLHVRTQKQLAEWKNEHDKCSVTLAKRALEGPEEYGEKTTVTVEEYFSNPDNFSNPEDVIPRSSGPKFNPLHHLKSINHTDDSTGNSDDDKDKNNCDDEDDPPRSPPSFYKSDDEFGSNIKWDNNENDSADDNDMTFTSSTKPGDANSSTFSYRPKNGQTLKQPDSIKAPTNWSSWNGNPGTSWSRTNNFSANATGGPAVAGRGNGAFGTAEWAKQFTNQFSNNKLARGAQTRLPNGQIIDTTNMTTTNTTTTNITNNIININVKLCAPGFESIHMTDSRGMTFSMIKKQKIADHLQKLLEIMTDDENSVLNN
jgi:hypothetical protein